MASRAAWGYGRSWAGIEDELKYSVHPLFNQGYYTTVGVFNAISNLYAAASSSVNWQLLTESSRMAVLANVVSGVAMTYTLIQGWADIYQNRNR